LLVFYFKHHQGYAGQTDTSNSSSNNVSPSAASVSASVSGGGKVMVDKQSKIQVWMSMCKQIIHKLTKASNERPSACYLKGI
jgi:hypothetical protein